MRARPVCGLILGLTLSSCSTGRAPDYDWRCKDVKGRPNAFKMEPGSISNRRAVELADTCTELPGSAAFAKYLIYCCPAN
jgi:hypothetical protein